MPEAGSAPSAALSARCALAIVRMAKSGNIEKAKGLCAKYAGRVELPSDTAQVSGGALIRFLTGEELPVVRTLRHAAKVFPTDREVV